MADPLRPDLSPDRPGPNIQYRGLEQQLHRSIPAEQMREWINDRVERILALQPSRVLEIGCGTGLMLFQIAPHCTEYWEQTSPVCPSTTSNST